MSAVRTHHALRCPHCGGTLSVCVRKPRWKARDWSKVDWSRSNAQIAREMDATIQNVCVTRKRKNRKTPKE
jgi:hypothetical protein